ncbi:type II toxin-antitoxin system RelE/ParE family toxin [Salegentibacter echinorum]|uniref:type II toxin-antitoxin system RelE/ParE family toxin n=1 Tax=Salegentibacter echinorum TaxID=1073325 RepID=UPI001FE2A579|nr:type II toxin-antitoxin system RelE/ParE family toxin [Salegentibacter echinorum]
MRQLEIIHQDILQLSKSLKIADGFIDDIIKSTDILISQPDIYTLDDNKIKNDGSYRSYEIRTYQISYRILTHTIRIIRVRYSGKEPRQH